MPATMELPRVFVVEDDPNVRDFLLTGLDMAGMTVQGFASAEAFLEAHTPKMRGCLVVDIQLPRMDGVSLIAALMTQATRLPSIAISGFTRTSLIVEAMRVGAIDFLEKPFDAAALLSAVSVATRWASTGAADMRSDAAIALARTDRLTPRERSIFDQFATGATTKQVADVLGLSPKTVETYRGRLLSKLDVSTPYALVRTAVLAKLFSVTKT